MKTPRFFYGVLVALSFLAGSARADVPPPPPQPYTPPSAYLQPVGTTALSHLAAAQAAVQYQENLLARYRASAFSTTIYYGGYLGRAQNDLQAALADINAATVYLQTHPGDDILTTGSLPANDSKAPALPTLRNAPPMKPSPALSLFMDQVYGLNAALAALANRPAKDAVGPWLGDLNGLRTKILDDLGRVGADLSRAAVYSGDPGAKADIVPLSVATPLAPDATFGPTNASFVELSKAAAKALADDLASTANAVGRDYAGDKTVGGYLAKVIADLNQTVAQADETLAYLSQHPADLALVKGPAGTAYVNFHPMAIPENAFHRNGNKASHLWMPRLNADTVTELNYPITYLLDPPYPGIQKNGLVLGDMGGFRLKILEDLAQTQRDLLAGIDFASPPGKPAPPAVPPPRVNTPPYSRASGSPGVAVSVASSLEKQFSPPASEPVAAPLTSAIASLALSVVFALGGLHFAARRK